MAKFIFRFFNSRILFYLSPHKKIQNMLNKTFPKKKFFCVYSPELLSNKGENSTETDAGMFKKAQINGTVAHITAIFGFTIAGLVVQDIYKKIETP